MKRKIRKINGGPNALWLLFLLVSFGVFYLFGTTASIEKSKQHHTQSY